MASAELRLFRFTFMLLGVWAAAHPVFCVLNAIDAGYYLLLLECFALLFLVFGKLWPQYLQPVDVVSLPNRSHRRRPVINIFINGVGSKTLVIRALPNAPFGWLFRELRRRHYIPPLAADSRLSVSLAFTPIWGGLSRYALLSESLEQAGVTNNQTLTVKYGLLGGARQPTARPSRITPNQREGLQVCRGCGKEMKLRAFKIHRRKTQNPACRYQARRVQDVSPPLSVLSDSGQAPRSSSSPAPSDRPSSRASVVDNPYMDINLNDYGAVAALAHVGLDYHEEEEGAELLEEHDSASALGDDERESDEQMMTTEGEGDDEEVEDEVEDEDEDKEEDTPGLRLNAFYALRHNLAQDESTFSDHEVQPPLDAGLVDDDNNGDWEDIVEPGHGGDDSPDPSDNDSPGPSGCGSPGLDNAGRARPARITLEYGQRAGEPIPGGPDAGHPFVRYETALGPDREVDNPYYPFKDLNQWGLAKWAKDFNIGLNAVTALLDVGDVEERLNLQFRNAPAMNKIIDQDLPPRPTFVRRTVTVDGETHEFYMRNTLQVVADLFGRPDLATHLVFAPEKRYKLVRGVYQRVYSEMHTAQWWWGMQDRLENEKPGATIIPLIISSDKTQLTTFRNRSAYPVYLTIGNIPKALRSRMSLKTQILVGYLPTGGLSTKDQNERHLALVNQFHACVEHMLSSCTEVSKQGVILTSGDGVRRRCHPILAAYVGDYPEQVLVTGVVSGFCPKGKLDKSLFNTAAKCHLRNPYTSAAALSRRYENRDDPTNYLEACEKAGVKPIKAFWRDMPHVDIYQAITPDILHQLQQGVHRHLITWMKKIYGAKALDDRFKTLPPMFQTRVFDKGISHLQRTTGQEHQDICRVLLGIIVGLPLKRKMYPGPVIRATRALLDFLYLAQYPEATVDVLDQMDAALAKFHRNKDIFIRLGARKHFNISKFHSLSHYTYSVRLLGTADNFNTQHTERQHKPDAKDAWHATNHKDEYPQMTAFVTRSEKIAAHQTYIDWRLSGCPPVEHITHAPLPRTPKFKNQLSKTPTAPYVTLNSVARDYGAEDFEPIFKDYVYELLHPEVDPEVNEANAARGKLTFKSVDAYHRVRFWHTEVLERDEDFAELPDALIVRPAYYDEQGRRVQGQFGVALIDEEGHAEEKEGLQGYRVGQVRIAFSLTPTARLRTFGPDYELYPSHFAYIAWFSSFGQPEHNHGMYQITTETEGSERIASILPIDRIRRSVSLIPVFGAKVDETWTSSNVLDKCKNFYVNPFSDRYAYASFV